MLAYFYLLKFTYSVNQFYLFHPPIMLPLFHTRASQNHIKGPLIDQWGCTLHLNKELHITSPLPP